MLIKVTTLPGDGIGPEVTAQAVRVLRAVAEGFNHQLEIIEKKIGGAALVSSNDPLPRDTVEAISGTGAVLLGAVGGPAFDGYPPALRPESGLLRLRNELGVFANLRPAICLPELERLSPLRAEVVRGTDILIVRELLGGLYFGERSTEGAPGSRQAKPKLNASPGLPLTWPGGAASKLPPSIRLTYSIAQGFGATWLLGWEKTFPT
jgi:3-isopropylmalate dehydrogenase